jgi:nucleoside-diphosphate kinase
MILEKEDAVAQLRQLMGATDPREAAPGTIRGDLKEGNIFNPEGIMKNVVHGSDSAENAQYEISIFF